MLLFTFLRSIIRTEAIAVSYVTERYDFDVFQNRGLFIAQSGWQKCAPSHQFGPMYYHVYAVTFVLNGCGYYTLDGHTETICKGDAFVIFPDKKVFYKADSQTPWEYVFATFYGADVPSLLKAANLDTERFVFSYPDNPEYKGWLKGMYKSGHSHISQGYDALGYFMLCMSKIIQQRSSLSSNSTSQEEYIRKALSYMRTNYASNIKLSDIATYIGLDRSYLHRLFIQQIGQSPHQWLINYRLQQGAKMLKNTEYSITEIAYSVGFFDAPHFTRSFRALYCITPTEYRKKNLYLD